jgi:Tfp pilus assembly protein PilX
MEKKHFLSREEGAALVTVLVAIIVLLPPTIVLATLALRWQRQSIDFRDQIAQELAAEGVLEEARARLSGSGIDLSPNEGTTFVPREIDGLDSGVRVSRAEDVVLALDGRVLEGLAATSVDLNATGTDAEGRVVYQFRKIEIYLVEIDVS